MDGTCSPSIMLRTVPSDGLSSAALRLPQSSPARHEGVVEGHRPPGGRASTGELKRPPCDGFYQRCAIQSGGRDVCWSAAESNAVADLALQKGRAEAGAAGRTALRRRARGRVGRLAANLMSELLCPWTYARTAVQVADAERLCEKSSCFSEDGTFAVRQARAIDGRFHRGADRQQMMLLPECLDDYVNDENPVRVIDAFVEMLDLAALGFDMVPEATGRPGYHPGLMLRIYLYGYLNQVQSSRRLERECGRNLEMIWLTGRLKPDFKTIADFRKDNGPAIRKVCQQVIAFCRDIRLLDSRVVAIDGSRFKAVNAEARNFHPGLG